jgi:hypothetical protein
VSKGTHVSIIARLNLLRVGRAKLDLVFLWMIELFHPVMRTSATITQGTLVMSGTIKYIRTNFTRIGAKRSSSILLCFMVEEALLWIMRTSNFARLGLKVIQIYIG